MTCPGPMSARIASSGYRKLAYGQGWLGEQTTSMVKGNQEIMPAHVVNGSISLILCQAHLMTISARNYRQVSQLKQNIIHSYGYIIQNFVYTQKKKKLTQGSVPQFKPYTFLLT